MPELSYRRLDRHVDLILVAKHQDVARAPSPQIGQDNLLEEDRIEGIGQQECLLECALAAEQTGVHVAVPSARTL
jgi:hypothetical protein